MSENTGAIPVTTERDAKGTDPVLRVGIIGAGIAGLSTAKIFLENGFDVLVFEKEATLGGVWAVSRAYPGLRANTAKETYGYTDYPYPETTSGYPDAEEVREYLESYAEQFGLYCHIKFNCEVAHLADINNNGKRGFNLTVRSTAAHDNKNDYEFSFVVICSGAFSLPLMPDFPGKEAFKGMVRHSSQCTDPTVADAERVVVIGAGKSALDCAAWAAREGKSSTIVFRKPHWMVPRYLPGGARSDLRFISRFTELFVNYPIRPWNEVVLHGPGKPIVWLWWTLLSAIVPRVLGMPTQRTSNFLSEYLGTFLPGRYGTLGEELKAAREGALKRRPYLSCLYLLVAIIAIGIILLITG